MGIAFQQISQCLNLLQYWDVADLHPALPFLGEKHLSHLNSVLLIISTRGDRTSAFLIYIKLFCTDQTLTTSRTRIGVSFLVSNTWTTGIFSLTHVDCKFSLQEKGIWFAYLTPAGTQISEFRAIHFPEPLI